MRIVVRPRRRRDSRELLGVSVLNESVVDGARADRPSQRRGGRRQGGRRRLPGGPGEGGHGPGTPRRIHLAGTPVDLCSPEQAVGVVAARLTQPSREPLPPLVVASANLDHIHHFGRGGRDHAVIGAADSTVDWCVLLDGMPLVWRARAVDRSSRWQRLAGSDILGDLLSLAQADGQRVGFLGGTAQTHARLAPALAGSLPGLLVAGYWVP